MTKKPKKKKPREWVRYVLINPRDELSGSLFPNRLPYGPLEPEWKQIKVRIVEVVE